MRNFSTNFHSHEIKNPLNYVAEDLRVSCLDLLEKDCKAVKYGMSCVLSFRLIRKKNGMSYVLSFRFIKKKKKKNTRKMLKHLKKVIFS